MPLGKSCIRPSLLLPYPISLSRARAFHILGAAAPGKEDAVAAISKTRNIGIIAHIDAVCLSNQKY